MTYRDRASEQRPTREAPERNPRDLRRANNEDRGRSPDVDEDVTGKELDRDTAQQLSSLTETNRRWAAKHLVMAGRLIDIDPQLAFEHALAASRRGGRLGVVREAVGLTAYAAGDYAEALRELRTYRRISGDHSHIAVIADALRGLGKSDKALEFGAEVAEEAQKQPAAVRAELAIVLSGAHRDQDDLPAARQALEIPELNINRAFSFSPRLFDAYADVLEELGETEEAQRWRRQIAVSEKALGTGDFAEPDIFDFGEDEVTAEDADPRAGRRESRSSYDRRERSGGGHDRGDRGGSGRAGSGRGGPSRGGSGRGGSGGGYSRGGRDDRGRGGSDRGYGGRGNPGRDGGRGGRGQGRSGPRGGQR